MNVSHAGFVDGFAQAQNVKVNDVAHLYSRPVSAQRERRFRPRSRAVNAITVTRAWHPLSAGTRDDYMENCPSLFLRNRLALHRDAQLISRRIN